MKFLKRATIVMLIMNLLLLCNWLYADGAVWADAQEQATSTDDQSDDRETQVRLMLDNQNRYDGMDRTYSEGYIPKVENGTVYLVAPMLCTGNLKDNVLRVSLNLGEWENTPFIIKNYEKSVTLAPTYVNDGANIVEGYVASFLLELKADRYNGSYPVIMNVYGADELGNEIDQEFTVYVTIMDGKEKKESDAPEEEKTFSPKAVISGCQFSKEDIQAGDEITADVTLVNTSKTEIIRDMTVSVTAESDYLTLLEQSDTRYVESIPPGGSYVMSVRFKVDMAAPQAQYDLGLAMEYADSKTNECSSGGKVLFSVSQPLQLQFDPLTIPSQVEVGDVAEVSVQVMNLGRGKAYNVRAVAEADGLAPQGTLFIGDLEPGAMETGSTQITVGSLSDGGSLYGKTQGVLTIYYQDEAGVEKSETMPFETTIQSPFSDEKSVQEDKTEQQWVIMAVMTVMLSVFMIFLIIRKVRRRKQDEMAEEVLETQARV